MNFTDFGSSLVAYLKPLVGTTPVLPDFRADAVPALVYDVAVDSTERTYDRLAVVYIELTLTAVAASYAQATQLSGQAIGALDGASWSDTRYTVLGAFFRTTEESSVERSTNSDRLSTISVVFDVTLKRAS